MSDPTFLYPQVSRVPAQQQDLKAERNQKKEPGSIGEFDQSLDRAVERDLNQVREGVKFSSHATQRLRDRKIQLDPRMMEKVKRAIDQAEAKGIEESLVLTPDAALIVSVKNRTVITALDRQAAEGNVFTQIDGAVIL